MSQNPITGAVWAESAVYAGASEREPHGGPAMRLNVCSRFWSNELSVAPYPITRLKAPMDR